MVKPIQHLMPDARLRAMLSMAPEKIPPVSRNDDVQVFNAQGPEASVKYRRDALLEDVCSGFDVLEGAQSAALWTNIRDVSEFSQKEGSVWRASLKPTDAPALTARLTDTGVAFEDIYDWSGGLVWLLIQSEQLAAATTIRDTVHSLKGHATLMRSLPVLDDIPTFQPQHEMIENIEAGLRSKFDPRGILNPGLMDRG